MNANHKIIAGVLIAILLAIGAAVVYVEYIKESPSGNNTAPNNETNFSRTGHLVKNNPGLKPDVWYIVYDIPSSPAVHREVMFTDTSSCTIARQVAACAPDRFPSGVRVHLEGVEADGVVSIKQLAVVGEKDDLIQISNPLPHQSVASPVTISGVARGSWFFEASFPVKIFDGAGQLIGSGIATAQGEWMTSEFVPFASTLAFTQPATATGTLVLEKDNPSGLPEHADELRIPIVFEVQKREISLFYYDPNKDKDPSGNIVCSRQGLVEVKRQVPLTVGQLQDAITLLLKGELTAAERVQGVTTEFPLPGVELAAVNLTNGTLTLEFKDPQYKTGGGSCRVSILWAQIEATAKQFPEVKTVKFKPEELFQP